MQRIAIALRTFTRSAAKVVSAYVCHLGHRQVAPCEPCASLAGHDGAVTDNLQRGVNPGCPSREAAQSTKLRLHSAASCVRAHCALRVDRSFAPPEHPPARLRLLPATC